jgi:hypothetical protein
MRKTLVEAHVFTDLVCKWHLDSDSCKRSGSWTKGLWKDYEKIVKGLLTVESRSRRGSFRLQRLAVMRLCVSDDIPTVPIVHFARHIPAACAEGGVRAERNRARWPVTFECGSPLLHVATLADASQEASSALGYESEITVGSRLPSHCPCGKDLPQHVIQAPANNGASDTWIRPIYGRRCAGYGRCVGDDGERGPTNG